MGATLPINAAPADTVRRSPRRRGRARSERSVAAKDTLCYSAPGLRYASIDEQPTTPEASDAAFPLHRQSQDRRGDRRDAADDRPVGRQAVRGHRGGHRTGHRSRRARRRARARRRLGTASAGREGSPARDVSRARSSTTRDELALTRGARLRQAAEAGARRCRGLRALLRVLRRRVATSCWRHDPLSRGLHRADLARAARRHRPHHPVELPAADLRPLGRRGARRRQRLCRQAGRGRLPVVAARGRAGGAASACPKARSTSSPDSAGRPARRSPCIPASSICRSPGRRPTGAWVAREAAKRHCPVTLELGGKGPQIVFADADLDAALPVIVNAIVQNAGQTCSAGSRLLVEHSRYEEVLEKLGRALCGAEGRSGVRPISIAGR